ncbi:MAG TPA: TIGR04255 family protein [Ktedonobacteraceae bacterium]|jgi:uncharacterized protein (TIGR04255 family)|nr:TIGR04255 family protein [Ktedonobacteraceae bacterium]
MQSSKHYSRAPLTEALIDLRVTLPTEITLETLANIHPHINDRFPIIEKIHAGTIVFQPDQNTPTATSEENGFLFKSQDGLEIFQATLQGFTFNRLAPYTHWEELRDNARYVWGIYMHVCKPTVVTRIATRFTNRFELPGPIVDLKDYLQTSPEVAPGLPKTQLSDFFMQLHIPQEECMLIVTEASAPPANPGTFSIILDFDLFREQIWKSDDEEIWHFLEKLRLLKNSAFEANITDKTRGLII